MNEFSWSVLIGGIAFFFLGLTGARKGLERVAGDRMRAALSRVTGNRVLALCFGAFITLILQSSGATSAILVSFCDTGLLGLVQAISVMLGSDIGTTFVVVLLSIQYITQLALVIIAIGFLLQSLTKRRVVNDYGRIIVGFGFIFYGMHLMTAAAIPLKESHVAMQVFGYLSAHPLACLIMAAMASAAIHSAGMIGIAIALAFAGAINFEAAIPIVLGANVGTCISAVLASFTCGVFGKRVALAHVISKLVGVAIVFPFIKYAAAAIDATDVILEPLFSGQYSGVGAKIALAHVLFNVLVAVIFLPIVKPLSRLMEAILPTPPPTEEPFGPKYLDASAIESPPIAFAQVKRELLRIASIAQAMFGDCLRMFSRGEDHVVSIEMIQGEDDKIDVLEKAIRFYLAELAMGELTEKQSKTQLALLAIATDFEEMGDILSHEMVKLAWKKEKRHIFFSDDGWRDLKSFQGMILENFNLVLSMLIQPHEEIALKVERHELHMEDVEQQLRQSHLARLHDGLQESFDTSSIHLDILTSLRRINAKLTHIAEMAEEIH
jgi:phosphate:Na+ symporter